MSYIPTVWANEVANGLPLRYRLTALDGSIIADGAMIELLNPVTPGTPVNATNLNHIEQGVKSAQDTADTAQASAASAQSSADNAANAAAAAQASANTGITKADGAQATANAAQSMALARAPIFGYAERTSETSTASTAYVDVAGLSVTITMPAAGTILVFASGTFRSATLYDSVSVRPVIDGTASPVIASKSCNSNSTDVSWVPFSTVYRKHVEAGARVVKLQMAQTGAGGGTVYLSYGNILVLAFQD